MTLFNQKLSKIAYVKIHLSIMAHTFGTYFLIISFKIAQ